MSVDSHAIARKYGTPTYVYDLAEVRTARNDLASSLPTPHRLYYSMKANPHPDVVSTLHHAGCHIEISSIGELNIARRTGVPAQRCLLTGPGKTDEELFAALEAGVGAISVESAHEFARLGKVSTSLDKPVTCLLRVNVEDAIGGMGLTMTGRPSPFGIDSAAILEAVDSFQPNGHIAVEGLHFFMGSNVQDENTLVSMMDASVRTAARIRSSLSTPLKVVDLGGGFGAPYARQDERPQFPTLRARLSAMLDDHLPGWRNGEPLIAFESGRYLVSTAGTLICRVVDVKVSKGERFVVLDTGIHHLGGMSGLRRVPPIAVQPIRPRGDEPEDNVRIVGPLCTPLDTWLRGPFPRVKPGDVLEVPNVGAYALTASLLAFISWPSPTEVSVDNGVPMSVTNLCLRREVSPLS